MKKLIIGFVLLLIFAYLKKPKESKCSYIPYFQKLNTIIKNEYGGAAHAVLDLDRLNHNIHQIQKNIGNKFQLRIVTKSLPSLDLIDYIMQRANTKKLMVFSETFTKELLEKYKNDSLDILLGKPLPIEAVKRLSENPKWEQIQWLIDTDTRLTEYLALAKEKNQRLKIAIEINVGLQRGGLDTPEKLEKIIKFILSNSDYLELTGLMGYDGHVPYVPFYINKEKAISKAFKQTQETYNKFVAVIAANYSENELNKMTFNSGGSKTYFRYKEYTGKMWVNDIAMGSGFVAPYDFSELYAKGHLPALFLVSPILKKIENAKLPHVERLSKLINWWNPNLYNSYFMLGGGWAGETIAPTGLYRNTFWDSEPKTVKNILPNQSILSSSKESHLEVGDYVFTNPWEGDALLYFRKILCYQSHQIVGQWNNFEGGN
ncbi:MAG TPA: alanine racemase [Chitinophagales bacterium]|nr:alanine racemase [Chitinophagales bacterium]